MQEIVRNSTVEVLVLQFTINMSGYAIVRQEMHFPVSHAFLFRIKYYAAHIVAWVEKGISDVKRLYEKVINMRNQDNT